MRRNYLVSIVAAIVLSPIPAWADGNVRLFSFPGSDRTGLNGVNDHNTAVGNAIVFPDAYKFKWHVGTGELTLIDRPPDFEYFGFEGINNHGVIVGGVGDSETNMSMAFIRQPDGSYSYFAHPDAHQFHTWAFAINEAGLVTGSYQFDPQGSGGSTAGFIYKSNTGRFTSFLQSPSTTPFGINRFGTVVGQVFIAQEEDVCGGGPVSAGLIRYGFVRHPDGFITLFQVNNQATYAGDIRDDGLIVGAVFDPIVNNDRIFIGRVRKEPCVFLTRARSKLIGKAGFEYVPRGIADNGRIVGIAIQRVGVDESVIYGFVTRVSVN